MLYKRNTQQTKRRTAFCLLIVFALHFFSGWVSWWHESQHHLEAHNTSYHKHCAHTQTKETHSTSPAIHAGVPEEHVSCLLCNQNWLPIWPSPTVFNRSPLFQFEGIKINSLEFFHDSVAVIELSDRAPPVC